MVNWCSRHTKSWSGGSDKSAAIYFIHGQCRMMSSKSWSNQLDFKFDSSDSRVLGPSTSIHPLHYYSQHNWSICHSKVAPTQAIDPYRLPSHPADLPEQHPRNKEIAGRSSHGKPARNLLPLSCRSSSVAPATLATWSASSSKQSQHDGGGSSAEASHGDQVGAPC